MNPHPERPHVRIASPAALLAVIPHLLRFTPRPASSSWAPRLQAVVSSSRSVTTCLIHPMPSWRAGSSRTPSGCCPATT